MGGGAVFRIRVAPNVAISKSIGMNARGVYVDNVSSYWLFFRDAQQYCPPFTMGWSAPLINTAGYAYMVPQTPFGGLAQSNVTPGVSEYVETTWSEDAVAYNPGTPGDSGSSVDPTIVDTASVSNIIGAHLAVTARILGAANQLAIAATTGQLIRILQATIQYDITSNPSPPFDSPVYAVLHTTTPLVNLQRIPLRISGINHPVDTREFARGYEFPVGLAIQYDLSTDFANQEVAIDIIYQRV